MTRRTPCEPTPRERLVRHGAGCLSDAELLSFFVRARDGLTPLEVAREALEAAGGLAAILEGEPRLPHAAGEIVPARTAALVAAALELARRQLAVTLSSRSVLASPAEIERYFALQLAAEPHEVFAVLFLDNRHRVIEYRAMFHGTIDSAAVYPREVVKRALACNASAAVFAHNHPSGVAEPSDTDVRLTRKLVDALALVDVRVLDHLVIGRGESTSLAVRGLM